MKTFFILFVVLLGYIACEMFGKVPSKGTTGDRLVKPYRRAMNRLMA